MGAWMMRRPRGKKHLASPRGQPVMSANGSLSDEMASRQKTLGLPEGPPQRDASFLLTLANLHRPTFTASPAAVDSHSPATIISSLSPCLACQKLTTAHYSCTARITVSVLLQLNCRRGGASLILLTFSNSLIAAAGAAFEVESVDLPPSSMKGSISWTSKASKWASELRFAIPNTMMQLFHGEITSGRVQILVEITEALVAKVLVFLVGGRLFSGG
ncbi:hypothetical protein KSP39_PZI017324 [Platanthera zijinensis]|uniref:Uncharacterized protein n=1 Tax=Platanthera zijinensis TaxID=2320716 RepID=A0AAP0B543_9ASPA